MGVFPHISKQKKIRSYLSPVHILRERSVFSGHIDIYLYQNQLQLVTDLVYYSDGRRYRPFRRGFQELPADRLKACRKVLILGGGLGSIAQILHASYPNPHREVRIVEFDPVIVRLGEAALQYHRVPQTEFIHASAQDFLRQSDARYDLICIDVFIDRKVPADLLTQNFLTTLREHLATNGLWMMNYIADTEKQVEEAQGVLRNTMVSVRHLPLQPNHLFYGSLAEP